MKTNKSKIIISLLRGWWICGPYFTYNKTK